MSNYYNRFLGKQIDLGPLGVFKNTEADSIYFCTPKGYSLIGWTGVDGVHYCFIRGFGDMVFAVSPMNGPGEYVHPVARSFEDFLRLLLACGGESALEQAWQWDERQFSEFLKENQPTPEMQYTMGELALYMHVLPMEEPFAYIKALQKEFDYSRIKFSPEYYQVVGDDREEDEQEWAVYFDPNNSREKPGEEIATGQWFTWGKHIFYIPAIYACGKGLVADFCMRLEREPVEQFFRRWEQMENDESVPFTEMDRQKLMQENPLGFGFDPTAVTNGHVCPFSGMTSRYWLPFEEENGGREARQAVEHYELDPDYVWGIYRCKFPWSTRRRPRMEHLSIRLEHDPSEVFGPRFIPERPGEEIRLRHPVTGAEHVLRVLNYQEEDLSGQLDDGSMLYPKHGWSLRYTLIPELPQGEFTVRDCDENDVPVYRDQTGGEDWVQEEDEALALIGGPDGPTAVLVTYPDDEGEGHRVLSALHFEPREQVEWQSIFRVKELPDCTVNLI